MARGGMRLRLNSPGVVAWLRSLEPMMMATAQEVAANADTDLPVDVHMSQGLKDDRPVPVVTIAHAAGLASQAKHGTLTRAAAQAGLDVRRYSR
ncbi:MAG: hypothetical protein Q4F65_05880 [Propionibacteriaceae bacterium]|nr:hypothetical protein [Propionibacteriaceae bacterium]